ncbi:MAG: DUF2953 domain-containing protein [Clostridia bacterium]|nr:DUF2953 domain-containing protein [Clostridia bacterium]
MTALWIILGIIALLLLLLWVRIVVTVHYNEEILLSVRWLFIKLQLIPKKKPKKEKKKKEKKKKPKEEEPESEIVPEPKKKKHKDNIFVRFYHNKGFDGVVQLLQDTAAALGGMFRRGAKAFTLEELRVHLQVGSYDASETAVKYGRTCAVVYPAMGTIVSKVRVKKHELTVTPDFMEGKNDAAFHTVVSVRPLLLIHAGTVMLFQMLFKAVIPLLRHSKEPKPEVQKQQ